MSASNEADESPFDKKNSVSSEERNVRAASIVGGDDALDIDANVQYAGILKKPPFGTKTYGMLTRWTERFCVVKESFLLYYEKSEKRAYEAKKMFNIHPKGVIPLAGCKIEKFDDTGKPSFKITHASFKTKNTALAQEETELKRRTSSLSMLRRDSMPNLGSRKDLASRGGNLVLAARNPEERDNWVAILQECSKVTWNNAQLGAAQIKILEENTARINKEKTEYIEKLHAEAEARKNEEGKSEELEKLAKKLEEEKAKMENIANQFKEEKEMTHQELIDAMEAMKKLDEERRTIDDRSKEMEQDIKRMGEQKKVDADLLRQRQEEAEAMAAESNELKSNLVTVEGTAARLADEKRQTEEQLEEENKKAIVFQEEKKKLLRTATLAQINLEEIEAKKQETEKQLDLTATTLEIEKNEKKKLEKRLRLAEDSLKRLDGALRESGLKVSLEIEADVTTLKSFFEEAAAEAELDARKHLLMEEAVRAKKNYEKRAYLKKNTDMFAARENMIKVDVDPRLVGESQSTLSSPCKSPENQIPENELPREEVHVNGHINLDEDETFGRRRDEGEGDEEGASPEEEGVGTPEHVLSEGEIIPEVKQEETEAVEQEPTRVAAPDSPPQEPTTEESAPQESTQEESVPQESAQEESVPQEPTQEESVPQEPTIEESAPQESPAAPENPSPVSVPAETPEEIPEASTPSPEPIAEKEAVDKTETTEDSNRTVELEQGS